MYLIKRYGLSVFFLCCMLTAGAFTQEDLELLDTELNRKEVYEAQKQEHIRSISQLDTSRYSKLLLLFHEYKSYSYDTAYWYVDQLYDEACQRGNSDDLAQVQLGRAFLHLSSGLFKESTDIFQSLNPD